MYTGDEKRILDQHSRRAAEINARVQAQPDDWALFIECGAELRALTDQLHKDLDALPKRKRKWWNR